MGSKYQNRLVTNRRSPKNERECVEAYIQLNPSAKRKDGLDVSAVTTLNGEKGYALLDPSTNRSRDRKVHRGEDFISQSEINKKIKK